MKKYELMALPYAPDALEPVISKETLWQIVDWTVTEKQIEKLIR